MTDPKSQKPKPRAAKAARKARAQTAPAAPAPTQPEAAQIGLDQEIALNSPTGPASPAAQTRLSKILEQVQTLPQIVREDSAETAPISAPLSPAARRAQRLKAAPKPNPARFNVVCIAQAGRLAYEAVIFARSFRAANPDFQGRLIVAEPQGALWTAPTKLPADIRALLSAEGAEIISFENRVFGQRYPHGNKIEALSALPPEPFLFFDTDTVFTGPLSALSLDFSRPSASMRREGTWPEPPLYGPSYAGIWGALYARFGLDFASSLDLTQPDDYWARYLYFSAGWFFGADAQAFGARYLAYAQEIEANPPDELACQSLDPWLDQVALPLVIQSFGGGRPDQGLAGLDGAVSCHYRVISLLYARESEAAIAALEAAVAEKSVKRVLRDYEPLKKLVYQGKGAKIREMFDQEALPRREAVMRNAIKRAGLWLR